MPSWDFPSCDPASAASASIQMGRFFSDIAPNSRSCARDSTYKYIYIGQVKCFQIILVYKVPRPLLIFLVLGRQRPNYFSSLLRLDRHLRVFLRIFLEPACSILLLLRTRYKSSDKWRNIFYMYGQTVNLPIIFK